MLPEFYVIWRSITHPLATHAISLSGLQYPHRTWERTLCTPLATQAAFLRPTASPQGTWRGTFCTHWLLMPSSLAFSVALGHMSRLGWIAHSTGNPSSTMTLFALFCHLMPWPCHCLQPGRASLGANRFSIPPPPVSWAATIA